MQDKTEPADKLTAEELQALYEERYEEQMRRMSCPGCGEEPIRG